MVRSVNDELLIINYELRVEAAPCSKLIAHISSVNLVHSSDSALQIWVERASLKKNKPK